MKKQLIGLMLSAALVVGSIIPVNAQAAATVDTVSVKNSISGCVISAKDNVLYTAHFDKAPSSDDGMLYLFELKTYEYSLPDLAEPIASVASDKEIAINFPLNYTGGYGRLYNKFVLAAKRGGKWVLINNAQYINNPEALATNSKPRVQRPVKALQENNVANIFLDGINTPGEYHISTLHAVFSNNSPDVLTAKQNIGGDAHPVKNNPLAGYMLCSSDDTAISALIMEMTNYATHSDIQDFVIGNEVNQRCWNYMNWTDWDSYVREYTQAFRICYTAIKSVNANAYVYTSLDQVWDKNPTGAQSYEYIDGKDFLQKFNTLIVENGNIDYNMSIHPYPNPLYYAKFWDLSGVANGATYKSQVAKGQVITFQNMSVLTNTLCQPEYLDRIGRVRDVIIGEIGMGTNAGVEAQAAGICASYAAMEMNPYVTQYLYLEYDINGFYPTLKGKGLEAFNAMGTLNEQTYMDWAKSYIGISDWSEVIH